MSSRTLSRRYAPRWSSAPRPRLASETRRSWPAGGRFWRRLSWVSRALAGSLCATTPRSSWPCGSRARWPSSRICWSCGARLLARSSTASCGQVDPHRADDATPPDRDRQAAGPAMRRHERPRGTPRGHRCRREPEHLNAELPGNCLGVGHQLAVGCEHGACAVPRRSRPIERVDLFAVHPSRGLAVHPGLDGQSLLALRGDRVDAAVAGARAQLDPVTHGAEVLCDRHFVLARGHVHTSMA